jgi:hypothetical protein
MAAVAAPIRCFLGDVPNCIAQLHQQLQEDNVPTKPWARNSTSNKRYKSEGPAPMLRLMGTVVALTAIDEDNHTLVLDDGTGLASIYTAAAMSAQIHVQAGMSLDCIVRVDCRNAHTFSLVADQLVVVQDAHAETLRWLELSYSSSNKQAISSITTNLGFPCRPISSNDIYRIIVSECQVDLGSSKTPPPEVTGLSMKDLAECLDLSLTRVEAMIRELQTAGLIYQNEHGLFRTL